ncbi:phage portal protein [Luteibacter rhizovicinus DSM 16549]|uniref:Phage portal protein n=1 Tax=Luteibacter rhizovicinus DSM 16549 TaxID=1440763 RepID=A0A0G9HG32_9GAMM|nr:phage portal protein [Luteibacter rhizovicinus]APG04948.1 phage portal protein [Luteibacter rhizovicinus DSM 16549]KLD68456.1 portal protein [Luteibacter rhizovicinus DSM 16549]KLD76754.1 portal protein [Xanthomonas hyacinthi DSM 19077]
MSLFDIFRRPAAPEASPVPEASSTPAPAPRAQAPVGQTFDGLTDRALLEYIRTGEPGGTGGRHLHSLRNMAALRCVSLLSQMVGMLPVNLLENGPDKKYAEDHPAYRLLKLKPNSWQTPFEFKSTMQMVCLEEGNAYARVIWSAGRPIGMIPLAIGSTVPRLTSQWEMVYDYTRPDGQLVTLPANEVFHLKDLSVDGVLGMSRMRLAKDALALARQAEAAADRLLRTGVMAGGAIESPNALSEQAYSRMKASLESDYAGAENNGKWMLIEEGAKANQFGSTARDGQHIENRNAQIEEVARAFGIPRPLLMMDDTSWGSGIKELNKFFVSYGLGPWFTSWEQAAARVFLPGKDLDKYTFKFNANALLRGTPEEQADYIAKSLGAGGQAPWQTQNEARETLDLPRSNDPNADLLRNPMTQPRTGDEPPAAA